MHTTTMLRPLAALVLCFGCTVESEDDGNPFATSTPPMTTMTASGGSGGSAGSTSNVGSGEGDTSSGGDTTASPTTNPMGSTSSMSMGDSSSGGGGNGMQPDMGMYKYCEDPATCDAVANLCMTFTDANDVLIGGFCTDFPCANPAADCDPSPGGTAVPVCVGVTVNMMAETACALDCSGGATCPAPMQCQAVTGLPDLCV